ncbi:MAG TPA: HEAT repeat domain-containing protein, partial [Candidatus Limnocylindria bacterium]|nr:HEAT repeat domain-containing protein [Candidatus Limnocylindria bacterium]
YRVFDPETVKAKAVGETKKLFAQGFDSMSMNKLVPLLSHPDMRVRQEAQFAIVAEGPVTAVRAFTKIVRRSENQFSRIHATWGLGLICTRSDLAVSELNRLLEDNDPELRAQAAKVLGDARRGDGKALARLLSDESPRARYFAAMALSKLPKLDQLDSILDMLRANNDQDVYLRHGGVMALSGLLRLAGTEPGLAFLSRDGGSPETTKMQKTFSEVMNDSSDAVRMATLLALRRAESPDIAQFLQDANPLIVAEAARAINDLPITNALPKLAALIEQDDKLTAFPAGDAEHSGPRDGLLRRVINANYRVGQSENAAALAGFAATSKARESIRAEAITLLGEWAKPSGRDRITGLWRPIEKRDPQIAAAALQPHLNALQKSSPNAIKLAATKAAGVLNIIGEGARSIEIVADTGADSNLRIEALKSMARTKDAQLAEAVQVALTSQDEALRKEATKIQAQLQPNDALAQLHPTLENGSLSEKQNAFAMLGALTNAEADQVIAQWLDKLLAKDVQPELQLDLIEAAGKREAPLVKDKLRKFEVSRPAADDMRSYRECLVGGNAEEGKKIFLEKVEASCVRCHKFNGEGGEVGPELTGMGARKDRDYILESIVFPNKHIAEGYESVIVTLKNGMAYAGQLKSESPQTLEINSPEDGLIPIKKSEIKTRERGLSAMPEELRQVLTKQDLRNLVEFLAQSKDGGATAAESK